MLKDALNTFGIWMGDHGWRIIFIIILSLVLRKFGVVIISRIIGHSIETSERFENIRDRKLRSDTLVGIVDSIIKVFVYTIAVLMILSELNVLRVLAPLLAGAGVLSLLIGFGIQTFVKDFISGIFIVSENQYRVGDVVSLTAAVGGGTIEGTVIRITLRATVIRDHDGAIHFIPNGNIARAANQTLDYARVNVELTLPIHSDLDAAERAINVLGIKMREDPTWHKALMQAPFYHGMQAIDGEKLIIEVRAKTVPAEQWRVSSELRKRLAALMNTEQNFVKKSRKKT